MRWRIRIGDRHDAVSIDRREEPFLVPVRGWPFVAAPESFRLFAEQVEQEFELLTLCLMHVLVNGALDLGRLLDQGDRGAHWRVLLALADLDLGSATNALCGLRYLVHHAEKARRDVLVRKRHHRLIDRHALSIDDNTRASSNAHLIRLLTGGELRDKEAREVSEHAGVERLAPRCRQGSSRVAQQVQQAPSVQAEAANVGIVDERRARIAILVVLVPVAAKLEDLAAVLVDRHAIRQQQALVAQMARRKPIKVKLAIAFVDRVFAVFLPRRLNVDALDVGFLEIDHRVLRRWRRKLDVAIHAEELHALHDRRAHLDALRDPASIGEVGRGVVHDQVLSVDAFGHRTPAHRVHVDLLEARASEHCHQQHAIGVGVVLLRLLREIEVEVLLKAIGQLVRLRRSLAHVLDLDGAVRREKLGACIGPCHQHGFKQQRVPHHGHALDRRTGRSNVALRLFKLETEKLKAPRPRLQPFGP